MVGSEGSTLQLGMALSHHGGGGAGIELCRGEGRRVNTWHPLSRLLSVMWTGGARPRVREVPVYLCHLSECAQGLCFVFLQSGCAGAADSREGG